MPATELTQEELQMLYRAIVDVHLPIEAKRALATEIRTQGITGQRHISESLLKKLGLTSANLT